MKKWIVLLTMLCFLTLSACETSDTDDTDDVIEDNTVMVYFNVDGGTAVDPITVEKGDTISPPVEPLKTGYTFGGWYYDTEYTLPVNFRRTIESNTQIYVKWVEDEQSNNTPIIITFDTNGGNTIAPLSAEARSSLYLPTPIKSGYIFDGWYTNSTLSSPFADSTMPSSDITLYAKWIEDSPSLSTITFNTQGGNTIAPMSAEAGSSITLPTPLRNGYTFDGWYTNSALTSLFTQTSMPSSNLTLYAKWVQNTPTMSTITFNTQGGNSLTAYSAEPGTSLSLPTPQRSGYTFDGWYSNSALTSLFTQSSMPSSDITLYAKWIEDGPTMITISFNVNGGYPISPVSIEAGSTYWPAPLPSKSGYDFVGWFTNSALTTPLASYTVFNSNTTLYAKWQEAVTNVSILADYLENDWGFTCTNNICVLQDTSTITYTFNLNTLIFIKELDDNSTSGDEQTKHEIVEINEYWNVSYSISIVYLGTQTANMSVNGNGQTGSYNVSSFSSNYLSQSNLYDDAIQFIEGSFGSGLVSVMEAVLAGVDFTMDDLK